jgi:DASS family divalent anion:Na+ symporter
MKGSEKVLVFVFTGLAILWATTQFHGVDTLVAALAGLTALLLTQVLTWNDVADEKAAWDTLLWWGGMLSLATALNQSDVPQWFAGLVGGTVSGLGPIVALIAVVVAYTYAHYAFAGQTAHVVALYTPFLAVAVAAGAPAMLSALLLCFFSNLNATLTPYSSGSGPIYLGSGYIEQRDWWRVGFLISLVHLAVWLGVGLPWWKVIGVW